MDWLNEILRQLGVIWNAPVPFVVMAIAVAYGTFLFVRHHYEGRISDLGSRLALRDDEIARFERNVAAPSGSALVPLDQPSEPATSGGPGKASGGDRVFVGPKVTPKYLMELHKDVTAVQGARIAEVYLGKWMTISGIVRNVYPNGNVIVDFADTKMPEATLLMFREGSERIDILHPDDEITAIGQIMTVNRFDVTFENCELVSAP